MKIKERAISILLSLVMVLAFMPALAFAEEGEAAADFDGAPAVEEASEAIAEDFTPAEPERVQTEAQNVADDAYPVAISYSPNPIMVWGPSITVPDDNGTPYYEIWARHKCVYPDGSYSYYAYAPGDVLTVTYSDGSVIAYPYSDVYFDGDSGWFTDGIDYLWPNLYPNSEKLVPGSNAATVDLYGVTAPVTIFVDTPELLAQREEAARQGIPDGSIPKVKTKKPSTGKKSITVKWKKLTKKQLKKSKATNYEVWVCPNLGFARGETSEHIIKKNKAGVKIKKVPKGTYYVKVRAIRKDANGVKHVGKWTKPKKVKVKK